MKQRLTKIIFFSLFLIYSLLLNVEAEPIKDQAKQAEGLTKMDIWESDSNTILSIISGLRHIEEESPTDSDLQKEHKAELRKKKYNEEFSRIKKVYYNKPFSLQAAMVTDVIPETKLNREGLREKRKVDAAAKTGNPKRDYLAVQFEKNQYKYRVETGNYEIRFSIPVPDPGGYSKFSKGIKKAGATGSDSYDTEDRFNVDIILIVKSRTKALKYSKEAVIPVTGKITEIKHGYTFMDEYVVIRLAE